MKYIGTRSMIRLCLALLFALVLALPGASSAWADEDIGTLSNLQDDLSPGGDISLTKDYTYSAVDYGLVNGIGVPSTVSSLDLNGHTIRPMGMGRLFIVFNDKDTLTLLDSSEGKTGTITGGNADGNGGGVYVSSGSFTMTGGTITGGNAEGDGGGLYVSSDASFTMTGGTISNNGAQYGGGVCVYSGGSFTMTGGSITGNTAAEHGDGVYVYSGGSFSLSGAPMIGGEVYLGGSSVITVTGELTNTDPIPVTMENPGVFAKADSSYNNGRLTESDIAKFTSSDSGYTVTLNDDGEAELVPVTWASLQAVLGRNSNVRLVTDITADSDDTSLAVPEDVTAVLDLNGCTIDGSAVSEYSIFEVSGSLTLNDSSQAGGGTVSCGDDGSAVIVIGSFTMSGGRLTGGSGSCGVYVDNGTFSLSGASAIENGVFLRSSVITVTGELTNTDPIPVNMENPGVFTGGLSGKGSAANFVSSSANFGIRENGGEAGLYELYSISGTGSSTGGSVSASVNGQTVTQAAEDDTVTLTVTPAAGYVLSSLTYTTDGGEPVAIADNQFTMPAYPVTVSAAFGPDPAHFEQTGDNEYTIHTAAGWGVFCDCLNDNDTWNRFSGKTVKLGANITVTRKAGSSKHDFCGTFDGDGKTLTFNYGGTDSYKNEQYIAPFSYVSNVNDVPATIRNLHVAGDIYISAKYAAGFISQFWGTVNIENCRSSVVIHSGISGDGTHGGFVAEAHGTLNFTGCIFDGKLLTTNGTTSCGGFVGYGGTVNISDSLYAPAAIGAGETEVLGTESATFNRTASTLTNCYYTRTLGEAQGEAIGLITLPDGVTASAASGDTVDYDSKTWYIAGKTVTLNATPADGCELSSLTYTYTPDGGEATTVTIEPVEGVYSFTMPAGDVTVSAVFMPFFDSVTATGVSTVYDDQLHSGTVVVKTGELNKAYTVYYNTNGVPLTEENYGSYGSPNVPAFKDAGDHTVYYLAVSDGYKPQGGSYTVSIEKAPLSVKAPDTELFYGDPPAEEALNHLSTELSALTITGLKGEDTAAEALNGTPAYSTAYAQYGDVGDYDITLSGLSSSNYALTLLPGTLTVSPKEVHFTWTGTANFEYNGKERKLAVPTVNDLVGSDAITAICSGNAASHAGSYTARVTGLSGEKAGNYSFKTNENTASRAWTITQAANAWTTEPTLLYATGTEPGQYSYLAAAKYGVVVEDGIEYDEESKTYTLSVYVEGTDDFNGIEVTMATYTVPDTSPTTEPTLAEDETITLTYGQALFTVKDGKYRTGYKTDYHEGDPAGTYQIVKDPEEGKVYTPGVITVNKKEVALTWSKPDTFPYDGKEHAVTASVTSGLETGDSVYVTAYQDNSKTDAGSYTAYATAFGGTGAENYTITNAGTGYAWSITAAENAFTTPLSMSGWTYGESPKEPAAAAKYGAVTYTYYTDSACQNKTTPANSGASAEGGKPVKAGTWYVRASVPADAGAGYGELTSDAVSFTIGKRSLLLVAEDKNSLVGEAIVELTYTMTGSLAAGDTADGIGIAITTGATSGSSVGTYPITVTVDAEKSANYEVITVNGSYFVAQKISVNASGYSQAYDGAEHGITVNVTDPSSGATIKYGESADSCTQAASPTIKNVSDSPKTVYFKVTAENYADYTGSATITISEADAVPATVTANNSAYDGTAHQLISEDKTTLVGGDMQYALGENGSTPPTTGWSTSTPTATNAGTYYVWYKVVGDANHSDSAPVCVTVTIAALAVAPSLTGYPYYYDGNEHGVTATGASGGTVYYRTSTDNESWTSWREWIDWQTTSVGKRTNAGVTYVQAYTKGDNDHADSGVVTEVVNIQKADPRATYQEPLSATYGQTLADVHLTSTGNVPGKWAWRDADTTSVGNAGEHNPEAIFTPEDATNYNTVGTSVRLTVYKANAVSATVTANYCTYDGTAQPLVTVTGDAVGGTMYYAVTTENKAPTNDSLYTTSIPTATNAGTYYVWYKVKGDDNHYPTDPAVVSATIGERDVLIKGLGAMDKIYDDTTTATISGTASLDNKIASDDVSIQAGNAAFDSADAGENRTVTFTGYYLIGEAAGNYNLVSQPDPVTAKIEKRPVKITANAQTVPVGDAIAEMEVSTETGTDKGILKDRGHVLAEVTLTPDPDPRSSDHLIDTGTIAATGAVIKKDNTDVTANYVITYQDGHLNITKGYQTITAENVTVTYGDTDKKVVASVTRPATGGGSISYAVKDGSADYIEVNASTGALTIKKVPVDGKAYVVVTASGTAIYEQATKEVTVTINKANAVPATVSANNRTYDGTQKPLVTVDNSTLMGGTMYYALGENADTAPDFDGTSQSESKKWITSIPTATNAGTYYVWYKVVGDANHNDTQAAKITVTISKATVTAPTIASKTYTGEAQTATVTASTLYSVTTNNGGTNVGSYDVVLTLTDPANYKWTDSTEAAKTLSFNITKATAPTVTVPTPSAVTYDPAKTLADISLPDGWAWVTGTTVPTVTNSGYEAALTVDDANYDYTNVQGYSASTHKVTRTVSLTVNKAAATVTTAPTAKTLSFTGSAQELVTAGTATGGTLYYAVTTENTAPTDENLYTASIPTATDAGTYYIWYKVVGDANHSDTEPASVKVTINYTVTFETDGGTPVPEAQLVESGKNATYPDTVPTRDGSSFGGWYLDDEPFRFSSTPITGNVTLTAKWKANQYTIIWVDDDGTYLAATTAAHGETPTYTAPAKQADVQFTYEFKAWDPVPQAATESAIYHATYTTTERVFTITADNADANGSITAPESAHYQDTVPLTVTPNEHYEIESVTYYDGSRHTVTPDETGAYSFPMPAANVTVSAIFNPVYTVSFETDGGTPVPKAQRVTSGKYAAAPDILPTKFGSSFEGWYLDDALFLFNTTPIEGNITLTAKWKTNAFSIVWADSDGAFLGTTTVSFGDTPTFEPPVRMPDAQFAYAFDAWDPAPQPATATAVYRATYIPVPLFGPPTFTLPASTKSVGESAFEGAAMTVVDIPEGCTSIGANAFKDCANLTQIRIPASVMSINTTAFDGCANVLVYGTAGSAAQTFCDNHANCAFVAEN